MSDKSGGDLPNQRLPSEANILVMTASSGFAWVKIKFCTN
jgi:hypothetical protein